MKRFFCVIWLATLAFASISNADPFLSELKTYAAKTKFPITVSAANLDPDFYGRMQARISDSRDQGERDRVAEVYQQAHLDPMQVLEFLYQRKAWKAGLVAAINKRLSQPALEIPGLPAPVKLTTNKTAEQLLQTDFKTLSFHEKTLLMSALVVDTALPELQGQTMLQSLMRSFHFDESAFGNLWPAMIDSKQLLIYIPTNSEWRQIMQEVGDPSQMDALGYTAQDPDAHRSLLLLQGESLMSFADTLKVFCHELGHVLQHRLGEAKGIDFYKNPLDQGMVVLLLEGIANDGAYRLFETLGRQIEDQSQELTGLDFFAASLWADLWSQPSILKDRRVGAQFSRFLFELDPSRSSKMYEATLRAVVQEIGINQLLWAEQMPVVMPLAPYRLLSLDQSFRSPEDQESTLEQARIQMVHVSEIWLLDHLADFKVLSFAVCGGKACDSVSDSVKQAKLRSLVDDGQAVLLIELSRQQTVLQAAWKKQTGQELTLALMATPVRDWPKANRDQWMSFLVKDSSLFKAKDLLSELSSQLIPADFKWARDVHSSLHIRTCTVSEIQACSTSAGMETDSALGWKTVIQLRVDGHSDMELLQSLFHEMTHHLQFEVISSTGGNQQGQGAAFVMISEGMAMWSALALPRIFADRAQDPFTNEAFKYFSYKELFRASPNQKPAIMWNAISLMMTPENWRNLGVKLFASLPVFGLDEVADSVLRGL